MSKTPEYYDGAIDALSRVKYIFNNDSLLQKIVTAMQESYKVEQEQSIDQMVEYHQQGKDLEI